jgi:hypothetical protein
MLLFKISALGCCRLKTIHQELGTTMAELKNVGPNANGPVFRKPGRILVSGRSDSRFSARPERGPAARADFFGPGKTRRRKADNTSTCDKIFRRSWAPIAARRLRSFGASA